MAEDLGKERIAVIGMQLKRRVRELVTMIHCGVELPPATLGSGRSSEPALQSFCRWWKSWL